MPTGVAPLLNEYNYQLTVTRILQSITGGIKIERGQPCCTHFIQWCIWFLPFVLSLPFLGVSFTWNGYYCGLIYALILSPSPLLIYLIVKLILKYNQSPYANEIQNDDNNNIIQTLQYIFILRRHIISLLFHSFITGLTGFAGFVLTDIPVLLDLLPIPFVVIFYPLVWLVTSISLYSLLGQPPTVEVSSYRGLPHEDKLQLRFIRRPLYVIVFGIIYIILRNVLSTNLHIYLYLLYSCYILLPFLWTLGILSSPDSLLFWLMEQSTVHLMGGTQTASEIRLVILFLFSLISTIIVAIISVSYNSTVVTSVLATGLGFLLSLNIIQLLLDIISSGSLTRSNKCCTPSIKSIFHSLHYTSFCCLESKQINNTIKSLCLHYMIGLLRNTLLVTISIIIVYFTVSKDTNSTILQRVFNGLMIALGVCELLATCFSKLFCCGRIIRNPLHPRNKDSTERFKFRRLLVHYIVSVPRVILFLYIYPLFMVTYIGINLHSPTGISPIWFGITTLRLLRKVWQNTSSTLHELTLVAVLNSVLPSDNYWSVQLDLGTQCLLISYGINIAYNIYCNCSFYIVLLYGFLTDRKLRTRHYKLTLFCVVILSPMSFASIIISSILSSPLLPLFTLPILITVSPRPSFYWPRIIHKSFYSSSEESIFYVQAQSEIVKTLNIIFTADRIQPGHTLLVRFQDRTMLVCVQEMGYSYWSITLQGLELQETSCHSVEVTRIDDIIESSYSTDHSTLSYWCNTFPCHVFQASDAYIATVFSDAHNSLSGIIDQPQNLAKFSSNLYRSLLYIILQYATLNTNKVPDTELLATGDQSSITSPNSSLSSMDITTLHRQVFSPSRGGPTILQVPSPTRASDIHLQYISPARGSVNKVTPLLTTSPPPPNGTFPSSVPLSNRSIATSLNNFPQSWYNYLCSHNVDLKTDILSQTQLSNLRKLTAVCFGIIDIPTNSRSPTRPTHIYKGFQGNFIVPLNVQSDLKWLQDNSSLYDLVLKAQRYSVKLLYDEAALGEATTDEELLDYMTEYDSDWFIGREDEEKWEQAILEEKLHLFSMDYEQQNNSYTAHVLSLQDEIINFGHVNPSALKGVWSNLTWELQYLTNDDDERYSVQAHSRLIRNIMTQTAALPLGYHIYESPLTVVSHI